MKILKMNPFPRSGSPDDSLREKLNAYSVAPPGHVWDNIEADLDKEKSRRGILFFIIPLGLLLSLGGGAYWYASSAGTGKNLVAVSTSGAHAPVLGNMASQTPGNSKEMVLQTPEADKRVAKALEPLVSAPVTAVANNTALASARVSSVLASNAPLQHNSVSSTATNKKHNYASINNGYVQNNTVAGLASTAGTISNNNINTQNVNTVNNTLNNSTIASTPAEKQDNNNATTTKTNTDPDKSIAAATPADADKTKASEKKEPADKPLINPVDKGRRKPDFDPSGWVWGVDLGPGFSGRLLNNPSGANDPGTNVNPVNYYNSFESEKFSMQEGVVFRDYLDNPHLAIQTGLYLINNGFKDNGTISTSDQFSPATNGNYTFTRDNSAGDYVVSLDKDNKNALDKPGTNFTISNNYWYLSVPAELQYHFVYHNITWFAQGGLSLKFLIDDYGSLSYSNKPAGAWDQVTEVGTYKAFGFGSQARAGVMLPIANDRLILEISPGVNFDLSSMTNGTAYSIYPYSFQMNVGIFKKL